MHRDRKVSNPILINQSINPQYCGISDLQNVSSVAKTSDLAGKGQGNRVDVPDDPTEMTTTNLSSNVCHVALQHHDEAPHLTTNVQICSCEQSHAVVAVCHKAQNFMCMTPSTSQDTDARRLKHICFEDSGSQRSSVYPQHSIWICMGSELVHMFHCC